MEGSDNEVDNTKKEDIIKACINEFAEYGYKDANTNRIAKEAGVSKGLIFHYYESKQKLFIVVVERAIEKVLEDFTHISIDNLGFIESLVVFQEAKSKFFTRNPAYYKILNQAFFNVPEELKEELLQRYNRVQVLSQEIFVKLFNKVKLKQGISRESAMQAIMAITDYIQKKYTQVILKEKEYPEELTKKISSELIEQINLVLYGISCEN